VNVAPRVVLVDDHAIFRAGLRVGLPAGVVDAVGEAGTVEDAICVIRSLDPDVVLLDVDLPDGGGPAVIRAVHAERPGVRFLALSVSEAPDDAIAIIRAGARGYVTKSIDPAELIDAIHRVADGDAVLSPRLFVVATRAGRASA
jgi:DNA-binding NarL/FixJ family response regulator